MKEKLREFIKTPFGVVCCLGLGCFGGAFVGYFVGEIGIRILDYVLSAS